jgi:hypothetical protein
MSADERLPCPRPAPGWNWIKFNLNEDEPFMEDRRFLAVFGKKLKIKDEN